MMVGQTHESMDLHLGDCLDVLKTIDDDSIDSIVSDPPYGLHFMGRKWDYDVPSVEIWKECLRVLKPGGHLVAFGGTRTYHRLVVNIEDAGFEIRDCLSWLYSSGFPKSHNLGPAIDKALGADREIIGANPNHRTLKPVDTMMGAPHSGDGSITAPATPEAEKWEGWGTALKPAHEPICLARKPFNATVVENVLEHGTGALNIDASRVGDIVQDTSDNGRSASSHKKTVFQSGLQKEFDGKITVGRWPANVILDEEAGEILDKQAPKVGNVMNTNRKTATSGGTGNSWATSAKVAGGSNGVFDGLGGASRFFYCPKASKRERDEGLERAKTFKKVAYGNRVCSTCGKHELQTNLDRRCLCENPTWEGGRLSSVKNYHPTVKPVSLMNWLVNLVTPPHGIVLDPFMGSGSTGIAARLSGFDFVGIELDSDFFEIAKARIEHWEEYDFNTYKVKTNQASLDEWFD